MASITETYNPDVIYNIARSILESLVTSLSSDGIKVPQRAYVGFSNPPEDCCPDLVVWASSPRVSDSAGFDGGFRENQLMCTGIWYADFNVRLGDCYVDTIDGQPLDTRTLSDMAKDKYRVAHALTRWVCRIRSEGVIPELQTLDSNVKVSALTDYNQGGCAGWQLTITATL